MAKANKLKFHTEQRKVSDLIPYELNPRKLSEKQQADLQTSLDKFGLAEIPVIDTDDKIIAGHQRAATMMLMGLGDETIDVRVPNRKLTAEEFDEYNIRSNKNTGDWDWDILSNSEFFDKFGDWGFSKEELNFMKGGDILEEEETESQDKDQANTRVTVGGYQTTLSRAIFAEWEESIIQEIGFNRDDIMNEILKRLKIEA